MLTLPQFLAQRKGFSSQFFPHPGATRTILVASHIWWTEQIALAVYNLGYNVLVHFPFYRLYTDDAAFAQFDHLWNQTLHAIRDLKIDLILAGNSTAMVPHPKTRELLHDAAGIPVIHYWWDEPRVRPPLAQRGFTPDEYLAFLKNPRTLNVFWDLDVCEEMAAFFHLTNSLHVPLATDPAFWAQPRVPLAQRPLAACFLGNCHFDAAFVETHPDPLVRWAQRVVDAKLADLTRPMTACLQSLGPPPTESTFYDPHRNTFEDLFRPWEFLNAVWMHRTRNLLVKAAADHLQGKLALIGKGWDKLGLRANGDHAGANSGQIYASSKISLNLFGGCVHGGMPLRPFDIAASYGLNVTHFQRELPALFEPGKECLAFGNESEMLALIDRVLAAPREYESVVEAGYRRVQADHTWTHRLKKILDAADARFPRR